MKIKYIVVMVVMTLGVITTKNTKAQETKNQYVKWNNVPNPSVDQAVAWLKNAMAGENIPGASVRSDAGDYFSVWGTDLYKEVLGTNKIEQFWFGPTPGGEQNYALNSTGEPVPSGFIKPQTDIIAFKRQNGKVVSLGKWGTNGCLNALGPMLLGTTAKLDDGPDPDVRADVQKKEFSMEKTPGGNVNVYVTNTSNSTSSSTSKSENSTPWYSSGEPVRNTGSNFQQSYYQEDPRMQIMQPGQLLSGGMYDYGGGGQQVFYRPRASFWDIANTAINAGSVVGQFINANKIANAIRSQPQQVVTNNYNSYPRQQVGQYPQYPRGPGFNWPNNQQPYNPGFVPISPSTGGIYNNTGYGYGTGFNSGAVLQPGDLLSGGINSSGRGNGFGW